MRRCQRRPLKDEPLLAHPPGLVQRLPEPSTVNSEQGVERRFSPAGGRRRRPKRARPPGRNGLRVAATIDLDAPQPGAKPGKVFRRKACKASRSISAGDSRRPFVNRRRLMDADQAGTTHAMPSPRSPIALVSSSDYTRTVASWRQRGVGRQCAPAAAVGEGVSAAAGWLF